MRRTLLVTTVVLALAAAAVAAAVLLMSGGHRWSWQLADLDRNRLDLAGFRGATTAEQLASWVEHGTVVATGGDDADVVVRYERASTDMFSTPDGGVEADCYRFVVEGATSFARVGCP